MSEITNLPLGEVIRYAEFGRSQMMAQMQAQRNYQGYIYGNPGGLFQGLGIGLGLMNQAQQVNGGPYPRYRRISDKELDRRYKQLTIDLEARHI